MDSSDAEYEVITSKNGDTVWVNYLDGSCIARFSKRFGIDVHNTATDQLLHGKSQCRYCTHGEADRDDWQVFRSKVFEFYGIEIKDSLLTFD